MYWGTDHGDHGMQEIIKSVIGHYKNRKSCERQSSRWRRGVPGEAWIYKMEVKR